MCDPINATQRKDFVGKSPDEVLEILKGEGTELTEEQLDMVAGGDEWTDVGYVFCPNCDALLAVV